MQRELFQTSLIRFNSRFVYFTILVSHWPAPSQYDSSHLIKIDQISDWPKTWPWKVRKRQIRLKMFSRPIKSTNFTYLADWPNWSSDIMVLIQIYWVSDNTPIIITLHYNYVHLICILPNNMFLCLFYWFNSLIPSTSRFE